MAQLVKCLPPKPEDLSLILSTPVKEKKTSLAALPRGPVLERQRQENQSPGLTGQSVRDPVSNNNIEN